MSSGVITTTTELDRESVDSYSITVVATDGPGLTGSAMVRTYWLSGALCGRGTVWVGHCVGGALCGRGTVYVLIVELEFRGKHAFCSALSHDVFRLMESI